MQLLAVLASYLIGSFPTGYLLGSLKGINIRGRGSGGTGATNVLRTMGWKFGFLTLGVDVGKGLAALALGRAVGDSDGWVAAACVLAAVVGHSWPIYIGFRGGKSVATLAGPAAVLYPGYTLAAGAAFFIVLAVTRYVSLGSIVGVSLLVGLALTSPGPVFMKISLLGSGVVVLYRHKDNIRRLLAGTENRFGTQAQYQGR